MFSRILFLLVFLFCMSVCSAQTDIYSRVKIFANEQQLQQISATGICVDHAQLKRNSWIVTEIKDSEIKQIKNLGIEVEVLIYDITSFYSNQNNLNQNNLNQNNQKSLLNTFDCDGDCQAWPQPQNFQLGSFAGFFTLQEVMDNLDSMAAKYPQYVSIRQPVGSGTTHEGRSIYFVKISDNPNLDENEPEILYNSLHHAREAESISQLIYYMWYLLENYNSDPSIQYLLNNTEMYFVPVVNPDGYEYNYQMNPNGGGMWRKNRRINGDGTYGVDLNRNYGYFWGLNNTGSSPNTSSDTYRGPSANSEPETQLMQNFINAHEFRLAVNNHTYSDVLIYPFGYAANTYTADSAQFVHYGACMTDCNGFAFGTANQTVGYTANGTIDDWLYADTTVHSKVLSFTPEAGAPTDGFWPAINRIIPIAQNTMSQNIYAAKLVGKLAKVRSVDELFVSSLSTNSKFEFKRLGMESGNFTVSVVPISTNISSVGQPKLFVNPGLLTSLIDSITFTIGNAVPGDMVSYVIEVNNGFYSEYDTVNRIFGVPVVAFADNCTSVTPQWTSTSWGVNLNQYLSAPASLSESPNGNYSNNVTRILTTTNTVNLTDALAASLVFDAKWMIEAQYDYLEVQGSSDNGITWTNLCGKYTSLGTINQNFNNPLYDGYQSNWVKEEMNLSDFIGQNLKLRFRFKSDNGATYDGFNLEDVRIKKVVPINTNVTDQFHEELTLFPNPANEIFFINFQKSKYQNPEIEIYDLTGKLVLHDLMSDDHSVQVNELKDGLYLVKILNKNELLKTSRLFIKKSN